VLRELHLPYRVSAIQPVRLTLPQHVKRLDAFYRLLGGVEGAEALPRVSIDIPRQR
jgi:hypothetical protein